MADTIHWADVIAEDMLKKNGKHFVAAGITPSGSIHIGNMREVVTADAVYRAILDRGRMPILSLLSTIVIPCIRFTLFFRRVTQNI